MSRQVRVTQCDRVLELLADGRWHSTIEFVDRGILRAAARVHELRRRGFAIESQRIACRGRGTAYEYRLRQQLELVEHPQAALEDLDRAATALETAPEFEQLELDEEFAA